MVANVEGSWAFGGGLSSPFRPSKSKQIEGTLGMVLLEKREHVEGSCGKPLETTV